MKVINLFGGPSTGKSSVAADLFALMKWRKYNVELVTEYAKDLTWEKRHDILNDQLYVLAKQNRKLLRLENQVDWCITDSPIVMGLAYVKPWFHPNFKELLLDVWDSYDNINIFLGREKEYVKVGRSQTEAEAIELDGIIKNILVENDIPIHFEISANEQTRYKIIENLIVGK